jgi:ElaB/YqjD/DUF883 family membrane-anchored ribosome-binding protein
MDMSTKPDDATKERLFEEFNDVLVETERFLKTIAGAGSDKAGALQAGVRERLNAAAARLAALRDESLDRADAAARSADRYVHDNPWRTVGIVAALTAITGLVTGILISRR